MTIYIERAYEPNKSAKGHRFLVDRLWPRGIRKEDLPMTAWLKDVAPSDALRKWFSHEAKKWKEFQKRYFAELHGKTKELKPLRAAAKKGNVTLLYGAKDQEHNEAVALKTYLESK